MKISLLSLLLSALVAIAIAGPLSSQGGSIHEIKRGIAGPNPYIFLTVPRGRSHSIVHGFEVLEDDGDVDMNEDEESDDADEAVDVKQNSSQVNNDQQDDVEDDENNDEDADDDDEEEERLNAVDDDEVSDSNVDDDEDENLDDSDDQPMVSEKLSKPIVQKKNALSSQMMVSREHAGAIMVPDEIIEVEGQSLFDEKTGKASLLLPRSVLDSIPDGSVVALLEQPSEARAEERANRVIVRRRRKGSRRNVRRRRVNNNNNVRRRRRGGNRRRRVNNTKVRVVRIGGNGGNRRRVIRRPNNRRGNGGGNRRRVVYQG